MADTSDYDETSRARNDSISTFSLKSISPTSPTRSSKSNLRARSPVGRSSPFSQRNEQELEEDEYYFKDGAQGRRRPKESLMDLLNSPPPSDFQQLMPVTPLKKRTFGFKIKSLSKASSPALSQNEVFKNLSNYSPSSVYSHSITDSILEPDHFLKWIEGGETKRISAARDSRADLSLAPVRDYSPNRYNNSPETSPKLSRSGSFSTKFSFTRKPSISRSRNGSASSTTGLSDILSKIIGYGSPEPECEEGEDGLEFLENRPKLSSNRSDQLHHSRSLALLSKVDSSVSELQPTTSKPSKRLSRVTPPPFLDFESDSEGQRSANGGLQSPTLDYIQAISPLQTPPDTAKTISTLPIPSIPFLNQDPIQEQEVALPSRRRSTRVSTTSTRAKRLSLEKTPFQSNLNVFSPRGEVTPFLLQEDIGIVGGGTGVDEEEERKTIEVVEQEGTQQLIRDPILTPNGFGSAHSAETEVSNTQCITPRFGRFNPEDFITPNLSNSIPVHRRSPLIDVNTFLEITPARERERLIPSSTGTPPLQFLQINSNSPHVRATGRSRTVSAPGIGGIEAIGLMREKRMLNIQGSGRLSMQEERRTREIVEDKEIYERERAEEGLGSPFQQRANSISTRPLSDQGISLDYLYPPRSPTLSPIPFTGQLEDVDPFHQYGSSQRTQNFINLPDRRGGSRQSTQPPTPPTKESQFNKVFENRARSIASTYSLEELATVGQLPFQNRKLSTTVLLDIEKLQKSLKAMGNVQIDTSMIQSVDNSTKQVIMALLPTLELLKEVSNQISNLIDSTLLRDDGSRAWTRGMDRNASFVTNATMSEDGNYGTNFNRKWNV